MEARLDDKWRRFSEPDLAELRLQGCDCHMYTSPWVLSWQVNGEIVCPLHFAAPDLLVALENLLQRTDHLEPDPPFRSDLGDARSHARAALARARGEA